MAGAAARPLRRVRSILDTGKFGCKQRWRRLTHFVCWTGGSSKWWEVWHWHRTSHGRCIPISAIRCCRHGCCLGKFGAEVSSLYKGVGAAGGAGHHWCIFCLLWRCEAALEVNSEYSVSTIAFWLETGALGSSIVKVPAAVCIRSVQANVYPNVIVAARQITGAGPRSLFTGYLPTLLEDVLTWPSNLPRMRPCAQCIAG